MWLGGKELKTKKRIKPSTKKQKHKKKQERTPTSTILFLSLQYPKKKLMEQAFGLPQLSQPLNNELIYCPVLNPNSKTFYDSPLKKGEDSTGTSLIAVTFKDGVMVGADSRTSSGSYVANRLTKKLDQIHDRIIVCRSGSSADTQAVSGFVEYYLQMHGVEYGRFPLVSTAAKLFRDFSYNYKDNMTIGIIVAGWDEKLGPQIFNIPLGGSIVQQPYAIGGSGSSFIAGYCDTRFKKDMSMQECKEFIKEALALAINNDTSSGGSISIATITKDGIDREMVYSPNLQKFEPL